MKIAVVMATYNGEMYLPTQLQSIADQLRLPDELIVCDDASSDGSREITRAFTASLPFPVHLFANDTTLGAIKNYEQALARCNADIIVLCDQDDSWRPEKLLRVEKTFSASPNVGVLFSDADLMDEQGNSIDGRLWQYTFKKNHQREVKNGKAFERLVQHHVVTGATMAFRGCFKEMVLPIPTHIPLLHDGWIALIISAMAEVAMLEEPSITYRVHSKQHSGITPRTQPGSDTSLENISPLAMRSRYYAGEIEKLHAAHERLTTIRRATSALPLQEKLDQRIAHLEALVSHFQVRAGLPEEKWRRKQVLEELLAFRYHRYSKGFISALKDLTI